MPDDKLEEHEAQPRDGSEACVQEPEVCRGHRFVEAADPADHGVGGEEGEIVETNDGGVDRFRRILREEREADRQHVGETDAVEKVECDRPEKPDFLSGALGGSGDRHRRHCRRT